MGGEHAEWRRSVPRDIAALGTPERIHRVRPRVIWLCTLAALACLAAGAVVLRLLSDPTVPLREEMFAAGIAFAASLVLFDMARSLYTCVYLVFPDALVHVAGRQCTILRWDDISGVYEQAAGALSRYRVALSNGHTISISPVVESHRALGATIVERVSERVVPRTLQALKKGGSVSIGPLSIRAERSICSDAPHACSLMAFPNGRALSGVEGRIQPAEDTRDSDEVVGVGSSDVGHNASPRTE